MSKKLSLKTETIRSLTSTDLDGVVGGVSVSSKAPIAHPTSTARPPVHHLQPTSTARPHPPVSSARPPVHGDNGRAGFMKIWNQIAEQQSGSYR